MLGISRKHGIYVTNCTLNVVGRVHRLSLAPHGSDEHGITTCQFALSTQRISSIYLWFEESLQEVVGKRTCVGQALQATVHKTSIAQITQSYFSTSTALSYLHAEIAAKLFHLGKLTASHMELFVFLLALHRTVGDIIAFTREAQLCDVITAFALLVAFGLQEPLAALTAHL